jgi:hypothetical protein
MALAVAADALPAYASKYSKHAFTQHQLFALLALREFLKTDYRGLEALLRDWSDLRQALSLAKVPDHSTLHKAAQRLLEKKGSPPSSTPPPGVRAKTACFPSSHGAPSTPPAWRRGTLAATSSGARASATCGIPGRN